VKQVLKDLPPASEGFPMRKWSIKLVAVGPNNTEVPANFIEKVTYKLHPTFEKPTRGKLRNARRIIDVIK